MNNLTFDVLKIIVSICAALITVYAVPYLKALKENEKYSAISEMVEVAVLAAEQTIKASGSFKKSEVMSFMQSWLIEHNISITNEQLSQLIECAVYTMNQAKEA